MRYIVLMGTVLLLATSSPAEEKFLMSVICPIRVYHDWLAKKRRLARLVHYESSERLRRSWRLFTGRRLLIVEVRRARRGPCLRPGPLRHASDHLNSWGIRYGQLGQRCTASRWDRRMGWRSAPVEVPGCPFQGDRSPISRPGPTWS